MSFILIFLEGLLSFLAPCVLPVIPLYFSYISSGATSYVDGEVIISQKKVFLYTLFFVLGICTSFGLLAFSFTALGSFFSKYRGILVIIGGFFIILFGFAQLGIINIKFLNTTKQMNIDTSKKINLWNSFLLGLAFSFAWTPCVGPVLSSILLMVSTSGNLVLGIIQMLIYTFGFTLPFLLIGLFTSKALDFLKRNRNVMKYTVKIGGIILVVIGFFMILGQGKIYYNKLINKNVFQMEFKDQYNEKHQLENYEDRIVILSFLDTTCKACQEEKKILNELYDLFEKEDVIFLAIVKGKINIDVFIESLKFPSILDNDKIIYNEFEIKTTPSIIILDKDLKTKETLTGNIKKNEIVNLIKKYL